MTDRPPPDSSDDATIVLRQARERFIQAFPGRCRSIAVLGDAIAEAGASGPIAPLRHIAHRIAGLAGTIGFPTVCETAREFERVVQAMSTKAIDLGMMAAAQKALRDAFETDQSHAPEWADTAGGTPVPATVLFVSTDEAMRRLVVGTLREAGYSPLTDISGASAYDTARFERPGVILLDAALPAGEAYVVCRRFKASPELHATPVILLTASGARNDPLAGLAFGPDDYLEEPVTAREVQARVGRLLTPTKRSTELADHGGVLSCEAFLIAAEDALGRYPVSIALVRLPSEQTASAVERMAGWRGPGELVALYGEKHLLVLMPQVVPSHAQIRVHEAVSVFRSEGHAEVCAGLAGTRGPGEQPLDAVLSSADAALRDASSAGVLVAARTEGRVR